MFPRFPRGTQSISYCLLVETSDGLLLVDTGYGVEDYKQPTMFTRVFIMSLGMPRSLEETAIHQVNQLGYTRDDVQHIVMTHLHSDHAGGLRDFPNAKVHVHGLEYEAIQSPRGIKERFYDAAQWSHSPQWVVHEDEEKEDWFGFRSIQVQEGLFPDVRLIPLPGHTRGHCGVAIQTPKGWLLHCGDATYPFSTRINRLNPSNRFPSMSCRPQNGLRKI